MMKYSVFIIAAFIIASCDSVDLSSEIGKISVTESTKGGIYFYRIVRGLSTDGYFLSMKNDICTGLNKKEDFYFKSWDPLIYYKLKMDTLFVYTNSPVEQPIKFGFVVKQKTIGPLEEQQYEKMYKENKIQKVIIDSIYKPGCDVSY